MLMSKSTSSLSELEGQLKTAFTALSDGFSDADRLARDNKELKDTLSRLFAVFIQHHRQLVAQFSNLQSDFRKQEERLLELTDERKQFKALYSTGLQMISKDELEGLIEFAMDQVTYHLRADRGFLILVDEQGDKEFFVSRNFDGEVIDEPAAQVSSSVLTKTLEVLRPLKVDDQTDEDTVFKKGSFVKLGLQSVLSVPLFCRGRLLGVIYLDREQGSGVFGESDLEFLLAFAKQIASRVYELREINSLRSEFERKERSRLEELREKYNFKEIIGKSERLVGVLELAAKVAPTDVPVLILGESGTGKELIARALHFNSDRYQQRFVAINCGAIPGDLLESELFGYEPGAFTGAVKTKLGKFEAAHKGTLFLDEVAELSVNLQAKILRAVQTKEFERLGSTETRKIDVRLISATNKELKKLVREGTFREDLYYRLKVVEMVMPPLRDRREDISLLVQHFMLKHGGSDLTGIDDDAMDILEQYRWDGNIRELENVIQRALILSAGPSIRVQDLPAEIIAKVEGGYKIKYGIPLDEAEKDFRRWYIQNALRKSNNNKTKAAESLGVNRTHFFRMLNQLDLDT